MKPDKILVGDIKGTIEVLVEGYYNQPDMPDRIPSFPDNLTEEEFDDALRAWKVSQDIVDAENANPTPVPEPKVPAKLKDKEGKIIADTV